jgi:AcrR family transcriptional regulator
MGIPERKEREKENRRNEILDAAQKVFFERGLQAGTMDEIAKVAELSKGTLYLYYSSKEDLYLAVMMLGMETMHQMFLEAHDQSGPVVVQLKRLIDAYYEFFQKHRGYFRMFSFFENPQFHKQVSEEMIKACSQQDQKTSSLALELIQRGINEGMIDPDLNPAEIAVILWSSANAILLRIDNETDYWKSTMGIDMEHLFRASNALLLEAIMSGKARKLHPEVFVITKNH